MGFRPGSPMSRERIMSFGGASLGKSYDFYCIARMALKTGSDAMFYIIDTDQSVGRMLQDPVLDVLTEDDGNPKNIVSADAYDWDSLMEAMESFQAAMRPQDWLMIDMVSPTWDWVQAKFTDTIFHANLDEYFLQARASMKSNKDGNFEGWKDWPVMNQMYKKFQNKILRSPGNIYCTAEVKAINSEKAEKDTKLMFGPHGVIPVGQKRMPHLFQSVLWKVGYVPGEWQMITIKDRSRQRLEGKVVKDFAVDYLIGVAGWKLS